MKYLLIFLLILTNTVNAELNSTDIIIKKYDAFIYDYINEIDIKYNIGEGFRNFSLSNGNSDKCEIDISYKKKIPILVKYSFDKDLEFTILHEISHCTLEKKVMYQNMDWKVKSVESQYIQAYINKSEQKYIENKNSVYPPMLIYHEIFADSLASLLLIKYNYNEAEKIIKAVRDTRYKTYSHNYYKSYTALDFILKNKNNYQNKTNEELYNEAIDIAQNSFIMYIKKQPDYRKKYE